MLREFRLTYRSNSCLGSQHASVVYSANHLCYILSMGKKTKIDSRHSTVLASLLGEMKQVCPVASTFECYIKNAFIAMSMRDAAIRKNFANSRGDRRLPAKLHMRFVDSYNTVRAKKLIAKYGWCEIVRHSGDNLWRVVQHSDHDVRFQLRALRALVKHAHDDIKPWHIAFLKDRVLFNRQKPQIFGSQLIKNKDTGIWEAYRIKQPNEVDFRRRVVGLPPLEEYLVDFNQTK